MTFLEVVNNVMRRLRENEVLSVQDTAYSKLIGVMVNDAKAQVENAYNWNSLNTDIIVTTAPGTSSYSLVGSGQKFKVLDVVNDTDNSSLMLENWSQISRWQRTGNSGDNSPSHYCFNTIDTNGDTKVTLWPTPDGVYSIAFTCVVPTADLAADSDVVKVPTQPVVLGAYARAAAERGEDQGLNSSEIYGLYKESLSDAVAIESSRTADDGSWGAV